MTKREQERQESTRTITLTIDVTVPAATGEREVADAINTCLDEPPNDWGEWVVGMATVQRVSKKVVQP